MNPNLDHKQIVRGIVEARDARRFDGWLLFVEALAVGVLLFLWRDNALIALAGFVVAFGLLAQKVIGTAVSIAIGGIAGWWAGQAAFIKTGRWDVGIAVGLIALFFVFSIHQYHVNAFERS